MLYVFQVDKGTMRTFSMNLAVETVLYLQNEIARVCNIQVEEQVLLVSGGGAMDPDSPVYKYSTGTDENPIYLFNMANILAVGNPVEAAGNKLNPPLSIYTKQMESLLSDRNARGIEKAADLLPSWKTLQHRSELAERVFQSAMGKHKMINDLYQDQLHQQQGWFACGANLRDVVRAFKIRSNLFKDSFKSYLQERNDNIEILKSFQDDVALLSQIPLLPAFLKHIPESSLVSIESSGQVPTLLHWINSKDNPNSLEKVAENCGRGLERFNEENFAALENEIEVALSSGTQRDWTAIRHLETSFYNMGGLHGACEKAYQKQQQTFQHIQKNVKDAIQTKENSVLGDLCTTHRDLLTTMKDVDSQMGDTLTKFFNHKYEFTCNLCQRFFYIIKVEVNIRDIDDKLVIHNENLKALKAHLNILKQIHSAPQMYFELIYEVMQRKEFSKAFNSWSESIVEQSAEMYKVEISRRRKINQRVEKHFLKTLFTGLGDMPPSYADKKPTIFDDHLPLINETDLHTLKNAFPDCQLKLELPNPVKMPHYSQDLHLEKAGPSESTTTHRSCSKSRDVFISAAERKNWTLSSSPPEPVPNFEEGTPQSVQRDLSPKLIKLDQETQVESKHQVKMETPDMLKTALEFEEDEFVTADLYIDESMPSSYTESNGATAVSRHQAIAHNADMEKQMEKYISQIDSLKRQNSKAMVGLKSKCEAFLERAMKSAETQSVLKTQLNDLKNVTAALKEDFQAEFQRVSSQITDCVAQREKEIKKLQESEMLDKINLLKKEQDETVERLKGHLDVTKNELSTSEKKLGELTQEVTQLKDRLESANEKCEDLKKTSHTQLASLEYKLTLEHELELDSLRKELQDGFNRRDAELSNIKLELETEYLEKLKHHQESFKEQRLDDIETEIKDKLNAEYELKLQEYDAKNKEHYNNQITKAKDEMEYLKNQELDHLRIALAHEKQRDLNAETEKLKLEHKNELDSLLLRYKLVSQASSMMEKSTASVSPTRGSVDLLSRSPAKDDLAALLGIEGEDLPLGSRTDLPQLVATSIKVPGAEGGISPSMITSAFAKSPPLHGETAAILENLKAAYLQEYYKTKVLPKKLENSPLPQEAKHLIKSNQVSYMSCHPDDSILIYYEEEYDNFVIFIVLPHVHFLHEDSVKLLKLDKRLPVDKSWMVAKVSSKEHCIAKKVQNRYNVPSGAKFYRVQAVPCGTKLQTSTKATEKKKRRSDSKGTL